MDALTAPAHDVGERIEEELAKNSCVHRVADEVHDLVGGHLLVVSVSDDAFVVSNLRI